MTIAQGIFLGLVQGLTEFLPVSSSGHLVIAQTWLNLPEPPIVFDVLLHLATLVAIVIFFGRKLFTFSVQKWILVAVGTIPAVVMGLLFKDALESAFGSIELVRLMLLVTAALNLLTFAKLRKEPEIKTSLRSEPTLWQALKIGMFQALALVPGISRSGASVAGGVTTGLNRQQAFEFSFLLAIPAILGANVLQIIDVVQDGSFSLDLQVVLWGGVAALISGLLSLKVFEYVINRARMEWFAIYCLVVVGLLFIFV